LALHIAIDASRTTHTQRTGTEKYALSLIRELLALGSPHHFTLYFRDRPAPDLFDKSPNVAQCVLPFPRLWTHLRFAAALYRARPDVAFVPAHTLPVRFPGRAVVTIHDLGYAYFPGAHPIHQRIYLDLSTRYSARRATFIVADSGATQYDLAAHYHVTQSKIRVIYPGVEGVARVSEREIAAVQKKYGLPERYVLFLGTLQPRKNITRLVGAYQAWRAQASETDQSVALVLAGRRGWLADTLPLNAPGVIVSGYVDAADVAAVYSGAPALAFPSLYEGFGFPVVEAMRCGIPVLCSNTSSLPELAGDAALLVNPLDTRAIQDGLARLVADAALRDTLVQRGYKQATQFTWRSAAEQTLGVLEAAARV